MRQSLPVADPLRRLTILSDDRHLDPSSYRSELNLQWPRGPFSFALARHDTVTDFVRVDPVGRTGRVGTECHRINSIRRFDP